MPSQIRWHRDWFNATVVMPQCPNDSVFRGVVAQAAFAALEKSVKEFHTKGSDPFGNVAMHAKDLPVWIFHGGQDEVVPAIQDRALVDSMRAVGSSPKCTEYPSVGHGAWDRAYGDEELWTWLFAQRLPHGNR